MQGVIGSNQFEFIKGLQIMDCILIVNEVIDQLKRDNNSGLIFKVDFEKAYANVN